MRKLYVSFTVLLGYIQEGAVTGEVLREGLFYFGCQKGYVFDDDPEKWFFRDDLSKRTQTLDWVRKQLLLAENEGRILWQRGDGPGYKQLNKLLVKNGFKKVSARGDYSYGEVADRMQVTNPGLVVVHLAKS